MLRSLLRIANIYWRGDEFAPAMDTVAIERLPQALERLEGQFSLAFRSGDGRVVLARDKYGINKLFFYIDEEKRVLAANYIADLLAEGAELDDIYSVPSGHLTVIDPERRELSTTRYHELLARPEEGASLAALGKQIRSALEAWFRRLGRDLRDREVHVSLSGGLDSSLIAALARKHFDRVEAVTYSYADSRGEESEDAICARKVAGSFGMPWRLVRAGREDILGALEDALVGGQDWRDFNVHCAIVNELVARSLRRAAGAPGSARRLLVLTGDLMNEIVADYAPVSYGGREYYSLPALPPERLRLVLIKGLDSGDREIGVFGRHGMDVVQPYALVLEEYLRIPARLLEGDGAKPALVKEIAGDLLPPFVLERRKVRAQIGTSEEPQGILPVLVDSGRDAEWLKEAWKRLFRVESDLGLRRFIRAGFYRPAFEFPDKERSTSASHPR
jgi:asparagine synthetase B (glutamine-hydrolysing)